MADRFSQDFKRFFLRGLAAMLPPLLTLMILVYVLTFIHGYIGTYVNQFVQWCVVQYMTIRGPWAWSFRGAPELWWWLRDAEDSVWKTYELWWIGFILAFVLIYTIGRLVTTFLGRGLWRWIERTFFGLPVIKQIYPSIKQVTDFLLTERKMEFSRVVAVEYPRKGIWSVGLVTSEGMRTLHDAIGEDLATVFVPSSPTPVTGYTITLRRSEMIDLPLNIDDALRFTVSGGVIMPTGQTLSKAEIRRVRRGMLPPQLSSKEITS